MVSETIILFIGVINLVLLWEGMARYRKFPSPVPILSKFPSVLILIPTCGESLTILKRTLDAVCEIDYPDDSLSIVVSDDRKDEELRAFVYSQYPSFDYRTRQVLLGNAKAGNLNDALFQKNEVGQFHFQQEFVLILDCDMAPSPEILKELVPMMYRENGQKDHCGFVQSPQSFINIEGFDFLGQQYLFFYQVVMKAWAGFGLVPCCGTNVLFDREELIKIGGFQTGSLTEDFKTSLKLHARGIKSKYNTKVLARGYAPLSLVDFVNQRSRWAIGGLQIVFSESWEDLKKIPFIFKWMYGFSGLSPIFSIFLFQLILSPLFNLDHIYICGLEDRLYIQTFLPYLALYMVFLVGILWRMPIQVYMMSISESVFMVPIFLRIIFFFLLKSLGCFQWKWKITPKENSANQNFATLLWILPYISYICVSLYTILKTRYRDVVSSSWLVFLSFQMLPPVLYVTQQIILKWKIR